MQHIQTNSRHAQLMSQSYANQFDKIEFLEMHLYQ
jgi:hypothetical protein